MTTTESELERTVREEQAQHDQANDAAEPVDDSDPNVLKLNFSGSIELDRAVARDVNFYNRLQAGRNVALEVEAFVTGPTNTHRRDGEGNVDAVVQTKSLKIHSLEIDDVT